MLLSTLIENVAGLQTEGAAAQRRFHIQKALLARSLADANKQSPNAFASQICQHLTRKVFFLPEQLAAALEPITLADVANFTKTIVQQDPSALEGLVLGNHDAPGATLMLTDAQRKLVGAELPFSQRPRQGIANLSGKAVVHSFRHPNGDEPNSAVQLVAQLGRLTPRQAAVAELLNDMLKQPFFDELRTSQQLGYIVGSGLSAPQAVYTLGFVVQSAVQPPHEVARRILAFLDTGPEILRNASDEFPNYVAAAQTQLREPPKRLSQAADMLWPRVSEGTYRFDWPQRVAKAMDDVTLADVQGLLAQLLAKPGAPPAQSGGIGKLLVLVHGKEHPLPDEPALASKIGKVGEGGWAHVEDAKAFRSRHSSYFTSLVAERAPVVMQRPGAAAAAPKQKKGQPQAVLASQ